MLLSPLGLTTVTLLFLAFPLSNFHVFNVFKTVLPVSSWKNASATMSLHFFNNFTGSLSLSAFSSNLQFLPSASLTILFQFTFLVHSLSINHLALSVLLLKGFSLSLPIHALFLPLFPRSGTRSRPISEISPPFHSSNPVLRPTSSNSPLIFNPS